MRIILLRHGETAWNVERRVQGCSDISLNNNGVEQLTQTGKHIADSRMEIDTILASPLQRARRSAEIVAKAIDYPIDRIAIHPLFLERAFGVCEGMVYEEVKAAYPDGKYPGIETRAELFERAAKAIAFCADNYAGQTVLVAAHGAIIKAMLVAASRGKIDYDDSTIWIDNGSYCILDGDVNSWKITYCNRKDQFVPRVVCEKKA